MENSPVREAFYKLPEEKRLQIINAAFEIFSKYEYKKASTDDIAARASISKGLLFYYFQNKKGLYLYLYQYCETLITDLLVDSRFYELTDFFELLDYSASKKAAIMERYPYIMDYCFKAFYSEKEEVSPAIHKLLFKTTDGLYNNYFSRLDTYKFKDGVSMDDVYHMMIWMADGFLNEKRRAGIPFTVSDLLTEFEKWTRILKQVFYKEEYQNGQ